MLGFVLLASVWQRLEQWDQWLFIQINSRLSNPLLDAVLPYFRDAVFWAPLYLFILVFVIVNWGGKGWLWSLALVCTVALADMTSARLIKEFVQRPRPCWDPEFFTNVRLLLKHCNHSFSFTSNHAANHIGIATFISLTLRPTFKKWVYLIYVWALFVCYAQVYVGVHYPLDILGGAGVGTLAGLFTAHIFNQKAGSFTLDK
jgi:membrane-associated phospholipid phosphatase